MVSSARLLLFLTLACYAVPAYAAERGVTFDGSLGLPSVILTNPDDTEAAYDGFSLQGRIYAPLYEADGVHVSVHGVARYYDLENTKSGSSSREVANHIGPGLGGSFGFNRLSIGYEQVLMKARHYYIGDTGRQTEFDYTASNLYAGVTIPFGDLAVGFSYSYATGKIKKDETGLSKDSDYKEQTVWIHLTYSTGVSFGDFAQNLVKK